MYTSFLHVYINSDPTLGHLRPDHHSHLLHCSTHISLSCVYINCAPELPVRPDHLLHLLHRSTHICVFCVLCSVFCVYINCDPTVHLSHLWGLITFHTWHLHSCALCCALCTVLCCALCTVLCCALCTYKRLYNACTTPTHPPTPTHAFSTQTAFVLLLCRFPNRTQQCNLATDTDHDFLL